MHNLQKNNNNDRTKLIQELLKKQIVNEQKKNEILLVLNYLEHQGECHKDDIYLKDEVKQLYDLIIS